MRLLDTNILSEIIRPRPDPQVMARLFAQRPDRLFASEMTRYELRRGACLRADASAFWARLESMVLPVVQWLAVNEAISLCAAELAADLQRRGQGIGMFDTFLAATARVHGLTMVTRNVRDFERVPDLAIENWFGS
jgi:predicted nucleic acid-binding protein